MISSKKNICPTSDIIFITHIILAANDLSVSDDSFSRGFFPDPAFVTWSEETSWNVCCWESLLCLPQCCNCACSESITSVWLINYSIQSFSSSRRQTLLFKVYWIPARSITFYDHSGMIDWAQTRIVKLASVYSFRILLKTRGPKFWKQHTLTVIFFFLLNTFKLTDHDHENNVMFCKSLHYHLVGKLFHGDWK